MRAHVVAQIGSAIPSTPLELIVSSDLVTKIVLGLLAVLSLVSWTIMLAKWREFAKVRKQSAMFLDAFSSARSLEEVVHGLRRVGTSPFANVFERAERFVREVQPAMAATTDRGARFSSSQVEALRLVLDAQTDAERDTLSHYVPWLATIGSASPLIGLLGTVLGIIQSFIGIATQGSGNVGSVAPGVAAALTATAAALTVAIPAVFGYNIFANRLNRFEGQLEGFGSELIALLVREGRI
ncbi:MAG: MotA/TolQ/ExbB proton channel family protein [Gemmatimonadaceae bacterium]